MKTYKLILAITILVIVLALLLVSVWYGKTQYDTYVAKIAEKKSMVKFLEKNKESFDLYKKILVQGSAEQDEIKKYVLSSATSFSAISKIELDLQSTGLATKDKGGLMSVTLRENADLSKYNAREIVIQLEAEGPYKRIDQYIKTLAYIPYVAHIERVDLDFLEKAQTTTSLEGPSVRARISLVITETVIKK